MEKSRLRRLKQLPEKPAKDTRREKQRIYDRKRAQKIGRNRGIYRSAQPRIPPTQQEIADAYREHRSPEVKARVKARLAAEAALHTEREHCKADLKYLWEVAFKSGTQCWGKLHELSADFANLDQISTGQSITAYSPLPQLIPDRDRFGMFKERWVYFRTLGQWPEVYDGPPGADNPISTMFYGKFWQGVVIRFKGDGRTLLNMQPRGHLKTTLALARMLQRMIREPSNRNILRSAVDEKASEFLDFIKNAFENRPQFTRLFGYLKPDSTREAAWNESMLQLAVPRKGIEPTLRASGILVEQVGSHWEGGLCDDLVGEKNSTSANQIEKTRTNFQNLQAQRDKDSTLFMNATRWTDDDCNGELLKPGALACFMCVTVLDGDLSARIPDMRSITTEPLSPLGHGKPMWNEHWDYVTLAMKRKFMPVDAFYYGQYFNQRHGVTSHVFKKQWIRPYPERYRHLTPIELACELKLSITLGGDAASGEPDQKGKLDRTGLFVLGQTADKQHAYWLDGCCEKLPAELIAKAFVNLGCKWNDVARSYGGNFKSGVEKEAHNNFLNVVLKNEMKRRGIHSAFRIVPCLHGNRTKAQRIRTLAVPYSLGYFYWPDELWVQPTVGDDEPPQEMYDLRPILEAQYSGYHPKATDDDLMDGHVYSYELMNPASWADEEGPQVKKTLKAGEYRRAERLIEAQSESVASGGYSEEE